MSDKEKKSISWLEKLKKIKHIEIYIAVIFIVILLLIYLSNTKTSKTIDKQNVNSSNITVTDYVNNLESNLEEILAKIEGVTNVKVMITLDMEQAEVVDSKINLNTFPNIKGVLITANGVNNTTLKMKVLHAVQALIQVTNGSIEILSSK